MLRPSVPPPRLSLLSRLNLSAVNCTELTISAHKLGELVNERANGSTDGIFDENPTPVDLSFYPHPLPPNPLELNPAAPIYEIPDDYDFNSGKMEQFCKDNPICIVRGLMKVLGIDLNLYSIKCLSSTHPKRIIKVHLQTKNEKDLNLDENGDSTWKIVTKKKEGKCTLKSHLRYMKKIQKEEGTTKAKKRKTNEKLQFGVAHLSECPKKFEKQLKELSKLPAIFRPGQPNDLLTLMGFYESGLSGVYSFFKVEGVRTPAHEEDGGIPSVNVAIGPGTSEWMALSIDYIQIVEEQCKLRDLTYGESSIWPDKEELRKIGVPVYSFPQQPGDLVFTGPGTLHWVQGESVGCNIAWNSGPLSTQVLKFAKWEYERNRTNRRRSSIPMERTAWRIATIGGIEDENVLIDLRGILIRSLAHLLMIERWLSENEITVLDLDEDFNERYTCDVCEAEVFNLIFFATDNKHHCFHCMQQKGGIEVHIPRRQRSIAVLSEIFDRFKIQDEGVEVSP